MYTVDSSTHSPLIGFAYDGFPIYGAYGYKNLDGTGGITRMKSSYAINPTATTRTNGPAINTTYWNGYFKEDYIYTANTATDYLDSHNGRVCNTPEYPASLYPNGIYCYFATVDANNTSVYPYFIGPTFYGVKSASKFDTSTTTVSGTTTYNVPLAVNNYDFNTLKVTAYPNPAQEYITIQADLAKTDINIELINELGQVVKTGVIKQGSTLCNIEVDTLYDGLYLVKISNEYGTKTIKVMVSK